MNPLKEFVGRVVELSPKYKAIVQFQYEGKNERALLLYDKLKINGESLPDGGSIDTYIQKDTLLKFLSHPFDESGVDRYVPVCHLTLIIGYVCGSLEIECWYLGNIVFLL